MHDPYLIWIVIMIEIDTLLSWGATYKHIDSDEILFKEGAQCMYYYQLVSGQIRWVNISEEGKEYLQSIIESNQSVGELPLFDDGVYAATAIANKKCTLLRLNKFRFHQLLKENPEIHMKFSKLLSQRIRFKFFLIKEITSQNPTKLILSVLKYMKDNSLYMCNRYNQVMLTRQQIADFTGLRVETVIRVIRILHEKKLLAIQKGKVFYTNMTPVIVEV